MVNKTTKPRIDPKKLDEYIDLLNGLWSSANKLNDMHRLLSVQEKTLAGGIAFQVKCPWKDMNFAVMVGETEVLSTLVNRAINALRQPQVPPQKPVFGDDGKGGSNSGFPN